MHGKKRSLPNKPRPCGVKCIFESFAVVLYYWIVCSACLGMVTWYGATEV